MNFANPMQKFQDWFTQQWSILWGRKINPEEVIWLMGPFGNLGGIGEDFIEQLAKKEHLRIERNTQSQGLIPSIQLLNLSKNEISNLSEKVIDFYENTSEYNLSFTVKWNPFFKVFGILLNKLFSNRLNQLHIPTKNLHHFESIKSEIITLSDPISNQVNYTIWLRKVISTGQIIYSGIYGICKLPSGQTGIKAVFPLPKGNATVIMVPSVGKNGELILESVGKKFGEVGFYFLLNDAKGNYWSNYLRSFCDRLTIRSDNDSIFAEQILSLWGFRVLTFNYNIV